MNRREFWVFQGISDDQLEAGLSGLLGAGARVEARIVAHLAEVEARRLHWLAGYSSLYDYCRRRLGLSEYEAFLRIAAARVARQYPVVFGMLGRRELHLTAICEVREFLTAENHRELLAAVCGKTKMQIREVLAQRFPQADVAASLKKLPALEPLSPGRYRLQLTLSAEQKEKLELARDLLSHANSGGDLAIVVERALDELIERLEKRRFGRAQARPARDRTKAAGATNVSASTPVRSVWMTRSRGQTDTGRQPAAIAHGGGQTDTGRQPAAIAHGGEQTDTGRQPAAIAHGGEQTDTGRQVAALENGRGQPDTVRAEAPVAEVAVPAPGAIHDLGRERRRKHVARQTRRDLLARDGVGCAFVGSDGRRCNARAFLQFHHRQAWARGGSDTLDNLELLCRNHNCLLAERDFGRSHVDAAIAARKLNGPE